MGVVVGGCVMNIIDVRVGVRLGLWICVNVFVIEVFGVNIIGLEVINLFVVLGECVSSFCIC